LSQKDLGTLRSKKSAIREANYWNKSMRTVLYPIFTQVHRITERSLVECPGVLVPDVTCDPICAQMAESRQKGGEFPPFEVAGLTLLGAV
jgi:hypothetical protein